MTSCDICGGVPWAMDQRRLKGAHQVQGSLPDAGVRALYRMLSSVEKY
jgi:hypothetical protein